MKKRAHCFFTLAPTRAFRSLRLRWSEYREYVHVWSETSDPYWATDDSEGEDGEDGADVRCSQKRFEFAFQRVGGVWLGLRQPTQDRTLQGDASCGRPRAFVLFFLKHEIDWGDIANNHFPTVSSHEEATGYC